ncbi:MAG: BTAD domain-containing putative transcriptional regulator [Actinomycetota bacterium]|nr:BTAD domain-containing putative transcriptional regulator [Actinomycetota bacterium]
MEFRILGPIEVLDDGVPLDLGAPKQRAVLAVLLLHANEVVSADRLVDLVWGEDPPRTAVHSVQIYVSELRRAFESNGDVIVTRRPGYEIRIDSDMIDARRFERLVDEAVSALSDGDKAAASVAAGSALGLWRGYPLANFAYDEFAQRDIERLTELHHRAVATLCEVYVSEGRALDAVPMLRDAVAEDPLREEPRRLLMLALFAGGRQAEALREFRHYREVLVDETGLDPSPELLRLEEQILLRDPSLAAEIEEPASVHPVERNPYKGLRAFDEADAPDFFGRDDLIERLLVASTSPLTTVVGPSGSGKSSAVRAGLIPVLSEGALSGSREWTVVTLMPGRCPFAEFDASIRRVPGVAVEDSNPADDASITRSILRSLPTDSGLMLLVVDQFEELFTLTDEATRRPFLRNLATAAGDPRGRIRILLTVRADFYDRPLLYPEFAELFTDNVVNVIPLTPAGIEAAAVEPAQQVGVTFAPDLLAELVSDMTDQPGALPLFQYTLTELFNERDNSTMTLAGYRRIGGLSGALSKRADAVYSALDSEEQKRTREVFVRLVKPTEDRYTRRPVPVLELESIGDPVIASTVLTRFGAERLLTFDRDSQTGVATVEVSHEALLSGWDRLSGWLEESRLDLVELDGLMAASVEWQAVGRDSGYLLTGAKLTDYESWRQSTTLTLPRDAADYIDASLIRRNVEVAAEAERLEREHKTARRARVRLWGMLVAVVSLAAAVTFVVLLTIANQGPPVMFGYEGRTTSWGAQMAAGVQRAADDFGIEYGIESGVSAAAVLAMNEIVDGHPDLALMGWGIHYPGVVEQLALDHPDIQFVLVDFEPSASTVEALPNTSFSVFANSEGSFLAGAIAVMMTETGKIGFVGAVDVPERWDHQVGYEAGARFVDPDVEIVSQYLAQHPDYSGFDSPALAAVYAREMYEDGVDVIFAATGGSSIGVAATAFDVTEETGIHRWMISESGDAYWDWSDTEPLWLTDALPPYEPKILATLQPHVLSSVLKRTDTAMYVAMEDYANGTFTPGIRVFGLANNGVDYSTSGGFIDDIVPQLEVIKRQIIRGEVHVPRWFEVMHLGPPSDA